MTCEVLVRQEQEGFIATLLGLPGCVAQAPTRDEAIERVRLQAQDWLAKARSGDGEIVQIEIDLPNARERGVGVFADDETFPEFLAAMKAYRDQIDADPNEL
jgi:predicted RNase H-like HicB family nuclease